MTEIENIIAMCRVMAEEHRPNDWPAVQMKTMTALCDEVERLYEDNQLLRRQHGSQTQQVIDREQERDQLKAEVERLRMQLAACGVVAMANTPESAARQRDMHPDYMSASCQDVIRAVDREMALRKERDQLKDQLYKYGCEDVDVIRCLKTLAYEHNHSDVPRYKDLAKRTMDKYVERLRNTNKQCWYPIACEYVSELEQERDQLKAALITVRDVIQGSPDNVYAFSEQSIAAHDAEVIELLAGELAMIGRSDGSRVEYQSGYLAAVNDCFVKARQLRQQTKEQNHAS